MLLYITHTTTYHYVPQVNTAQHMAHLLPREDSAQSVHHTELSITLSLIHISEPTRPY